MQIVTADHDAAGVAVETEHPPRPRYAHDEDVARAYMVIEAGRFLQTGEYRVAVLEPRHIRLEKQDDSGGTTFTITE